MEEKLREAACYGDIEAIHTLIRNGADINNQHKINGWTALHWAATRNEKNAVKALLALGASKEVKNNDGKTPDQVAKDVTIKKMILGENEVGIETVTEEPEPRFVPNYLAYPPVDYKVNLNPDKKVTIRTEENSKIEDDKAVKILKIRVANSEDPDYIEIDLKASELTYDNLKKVMCQELCIAEGEKVEKIRKLPNTKLRRDIEVMRIENYAELELVLLPSS